MRLYIAAVEFAWFIGCIGFGTIPAALLIGAQQGYKNMREIYRYFVEIKPGRLLLWCYLVWYLVTVYYHFDPSCKLWLNSLGISLVIGTALILSVANGGRADYWQVFRLYWMPFAVSSFAALIKNKGYVVIFSPNLAEVSVAIGGCGVFVVLVLVLKWSAGKRLASTHNKPA